MTLSAGLVGGHVSDEGAREICDSNAGRWPRFSGTFPTTGVATRVDGGWSISGRWGFASGIDHLRWIAIGTRLAGVAARRSDRGPVGCTARRAPRVIDGTWNVDGLRATGSRTFTIDNVFVPGTRAFSVTDAQTRQLRASAADVGVHQPRTRRCRSRSCPPRPRRGHRVGRGQGPHGWAGSAARRVRRLPARHRPRRHPATGGPRVDGRSPR